MTRNHRTKRKSSRIAALAAMASVVGALAWTPLVVGEQLPAYMMSRAQLQEIHPIRDLPSSSPTIESISGLATLTLSGTGTYSGSTSVAILNTDNTGGLRINQIVIANPPQITTGSATLPLGGGFTKIGIGSLTMRGTTTAGSSSLVFTEGVLGCGGVTKTSDISLGQGRLTLSGSTLDSITGSVGTVEFSGNWTLSDYTLSDRGFSVRRGGGLDASRVVFDYQTVNPNTSVIHLLNAPASLAGEYGTNVVLVPEPSSLVLLGFGAVAMVVVARRLRRGRA